MNVYQEHGFENRRAYLESLCEEYPRDAVFMLADLLGPNEDFDGLVTELEDQTLYGVGWTTYTAHVAEGGA